MAEPLGDRAVVAGGSLAGMLAARVLATHFRNVVVLERDTFAATPTPRRLTPQSHHVHLLLKGGENAIGRLVPGFKDAIEANGSVLLRGGLDVEFASDLGLAPRWDSEIELHSQSRPFLEHTLRQCVLSTTPNVELRTGQTVRGLLYSAELHRITGVEVEANGGERTRLEADLVADATGRGEGGLRWLTALGLDVPPVDEVKVDFGYSSATVELAPGKRDWKAAACGNLPRVGARGGVLFPIEEGRYVCSLGGRAGDYPPDEQSAFVEFAASLPRSTISDELRKATFVSDVHRMIYPANRFRRYERLETLVGRLIPMGDALCSFNPTYGQGMSCAALQAEALAETLGGRTTGDPLDVLVPRYLERAALAARLPWRQANFNDFFYPTTEGDRSMFSEQETQFRVQLQVASGRDPVVRKLANEMSQLLIPFERLLEPDIMARVAAAQG